MVWQKGECGNPGGRRAVKPWREAIERALKRRQTDPQAIDKAADKLVDACLEGDMEAIKILGDRLDGKPHQSMDVDAVVTNPPLVQNIPDPEPTPDE